MSGMSGNVLEYFIKATDLTGRALSSAAANVKKYAKTIAAEVGLIQKTIDNGLAPEKFVHTEAVLDKFARAMDRAGIKGEEFADAYDTLQTRLNEFNKTGKDADALMQHFRASMEDLGFSAKNVEAGLAMLQQNMIKTADGGRQVSTRFSLVRVASAALRGDITALAVELTKIIPAFQRAGAAGAKGMFIAGAAVMAVIKALSAAKGLIATVFNFGAAPKEAREVSAAMLDAKNNATQFAEAMKDSRDAAADVTEKLNGEISALERLTKAQNELARAQALAAATTDYERDSINAHFDRLNAEAEERASQSRRDREKKTLEDEALRLQDEIAEAEHRRDEAREMATKLGTAARSRQVGFWRKLGGWVGSPFGLGGGYLEEAQSILAGSTNAWNEADKAESDIADLKRRLEKVRTKLSLAESEQKSASIDVEARKQREANNQQARDTAEYEREIKEYEQEVKEAERAMREAAKEREQAEREAAKAAHEMHRLRMRDAQDELTAQERLKDAAQDRLDAAKDYAAKAWGFYLDRDALAAHNQSIDRDIAARAQYAKDYKSIRNSDKYSRLLHIARNDGMDAVESQLAEWRRKKSISLDTEATMRVAISEQEQREAFRDYKRAADAAERSADALEAIQTDIENGGEE